MGNCCVLQKPSERKLWWMGFDKKQDQPLDQPLDQGKESKIKNPKENPPGGEWVPPPQPLEQKLDKRKGAGKGAIIF